MLHPSQHASQSGGLLDRFGTFVKMMHRLVPMFDSVSAYPADHRCIQPVGMLWQGRQVCLRGMLAAILEYLLVEML